MVRRLPPLKIAVRQKQRSPPRSPWPWRGFVVSENTNQGESHEERNHRDTQASIPKGTHKHREGRDGKKLDYVEVQNYVDRLNEAFTYEWSFELTSREIIGEQIVVEVKLTAAGLTKTGLGGATITRSEGNKTVIALADDIKMAEADALKRACRLFGVGAELYASGPRRCRRAHQRSATEHRNPAPCWSPLATAKPTATTGAADVGATARQSKTGPRSRAWTRLRYDEQIKSDVWHRDRVPDQEARPATSSPASTPTDQSERQERPTRTGWVTPWPQRLRELRDGLHVSVSQVKCYLRCPRQYQFRYVLGCRARVHAGQLGLGQRRSRRAWRRSTVGHDDIGIARVRRLPGGVSRHAGGVQAKSRLPIKDGDKIEAQGEALLKVFYETTYQDPPNVVGVEVPFTIDLADPVTGEVLEEKLVGALDLVVRAGKKNVVGEHKTAARKWSKDQIEHEIQLAAYKMVARTLGLGEVGLRLQVLTKTKKPKMIVENTDRTERDEREFMETVVGVLRAVDAQGVLPDSQRHVRWVYVPEAVCEYLI